MITSRNIIKILTLILAIASTITAATQYSAPAPQKVLGPEQGVVERAVDGDTLKVQLGEKTVTVRLLGINTPESVDPRKPVECFGKEASAFTETLTAGRTVTLEADPSQDSVDKYGRLLRYAYRDDGIFINKEIVASGYGFEYTFQTPYAFRDTFKAAERDAKAAGLGLWNERACGAKAKTKTATSSKRAAVSALQSGTTSEYLNATSSHR
jgi:micrococcal nuclease